MNDSTVGGFTRTVMALAVVGLFFCGANAMGQSASVPPVVASSAKHMKTDVTILSDTQGVDFGPYLQQILPTIRRSWLPLLPEEARPPGNMQAETVIRFTIGPDGRVAAMHLDGSTHQIQIDRAAWGAIAANRQYPPLPAEFKGPGLEIRIVFLVNSLTPLLP